MYRDLISAVILSFCMIIALSGQTVSGTVDSDIWGPLPGVNVYVPHTCIGTVTDSRGNYSITLDSAHNTLQYSFIGFESQEITVDKDTVVNITLEESPIALNTIIIKGLYFEKRASLTGAIIKKHGLFRKPDTIRVGIPDTTSRRLEAERKSRIIDSIDLHDINDSLNYIERLTPAERDLRKYIIDSLEYPGEAVLYGIYGKVYAGFTITEESKISDIKILRGIDPLIDNEVIAILQQMPDPIQVEFGKYGKLYNRQVPKKYQLCIRFEFLE